MSECLTDTVNLLADRQEDGNMVLTTGEPVRPPVAPHTDLDLAGFAQALNAAINSITAAGGTPPEALICNAAAISATSRPFR
jgi:hypothetical protein